MTIYKLLLLLLLLLLLPLAWSPDRASTHAKASQRASDIRHEHEVRLVREHSPCVRHVVIAIRRAWGRV
jgi:hypothetical protein